MDEEQFEIQRRMLAVHATLNLEHGQAILELMVAGISTSRILALYPLELKAIPALMAARLTTAATALPVLEQVLDERYSLVLDELCDGVPREKNTPLFMPVIVAANQDVAVARLVGVVPFHELQARWPKTSQQEVMRAAITSVGESLWLAANCWHIAELTAKSSDVLWLISELEDAFRKPRTA